MSGTTSNSIINCPIEHCNQVFFNHTLLVQHYRRYMNNNSDRSSPISFDKPCLICCARFISLLCLSQHANECGAQYATLQGCCPKPLFLSVPSPINELNLLIFPDTYFLVLNHAENQCKKLTSDFFFQLSSYFISGEIVSSKCLSILHNFLSFFK